jgi:Helix-turn-helix domain
MAITHADRFRWEQDVLANPQLTAAQKIVLTRLALHLNIKTGRCDPSVKTLATGAGMAERTVQATLSRAETLGLLKRAIGGGRTRTTSYTLISPAKTVHDAAPFSEAVHHDFSETVHHEAPFEMETVHRDVEMGALGSEKPCTAVHPNSLRQWEH